MQKNWYAVYTKPHCENKVAKTLVKKGIEIFFPKIKIRAKYFNGYRVIYKSLFQSFVFIYIDKSEFSKIMQINNILNFVHWKGKPAIVSDEEVNLIREFTNAHSNIKVEKTVVNPVLTPEITEDPYYSNDGVILIIKKRSIKVNLPSLGFKMILDVEDESFASGKGSKFIFGSKITQS